MHTLYILTSGLVMLLFSCGKPAPSRIDFDGHTFELPIKVREAKQKLGLQYEYYTGFYKGNANNKSIECQLEDYPLFIGSDNDQEESYYDNYFVGISFFKADKNIDEFMNEFEKKYNKRFKAKTIDFGVTRTLPPFDMTYHYIKTDDNLFIALKQIERNNKKYISISFYKGISESKLGKYLEHVY